MNKWAIARYAALVVAVAVLFGLRQHDSSRLAQVEASLGQVDGSASRRLGDSVFPATLQVSTMKATTSLVPSYLSGLNEDRTATINHTTGAVQTGSQTSALYFGDGNDGNLTWDGSTTNGCSSLNVGTATYTLTRDCQMTSAAVNSTVETAGYRFVGTGTLSGSGGVIDNSGQPGGNFTGAGCAGGTGAPGVTVGGAGGAAGPTGLAANGVGIASLCTGGTGGAGGNSGGTGGSCTSWTSVGIRLTAENAVDGWQPINTGTSPSTAIIFRALQGGASGGNGGGTLADIGCGGGGGGNVVIAFFAIEASLTISANGGNGGNATTGGGPGGGGGGGSIWLVTRYSGGSTLTLQANGGNAGTGGTTTGVAAGNPGHIIQISG